MKSATRVAQESVLRVGCVACRLMVCACFLPGCAACSSVDLCRDVDCQCFMPGCEVCAQRGISEVRRVQRDEMQPCSEQRSTDRRAEIGTSSRSSPYVFLSTGRVVDVQQPLAKVLCPDLLTSVKPDFLVPLTKQARNHASSIDASQILAICCVTVPGTMALDLKTGWDLLQPQVRRRAYQLLRSAGFLLASPPCTLYSCLMYSNWGRMSIASRAARTFAGVELLQWSMWFLHLAKYSDLPFVFEHPSTAASLSLTYVKSLAENCYVATFDQCQFGLVSPTGVPVQKRTVFITNKASVYARFANVFCKGEHKHVSCQGISKHCEVYPPALVEALLESMLA